MSDIAEFISEVPDACKTFVTEAHEAMVKAGYKSKIVKKPGGSTAAYAHPKTKQVLAQFFFRKKVLHLYLYVVFFGDFNGYLDKLPRSVSDQLGVFNDCKRLHNPDACNPKCPMGYDFTVSDVRYRKCKYGRVTVVMNKESMGLLDILTKRV